MKQLNLLPAKSQGPDTQFAGGDCVLKDTRDHDDLRQETVAVGKQLRETRLRKRKGMKSLCHEAPHMGAPPGSILWGQSCNAVYTDASKRLHKLLCKRLQTLREPLSAKT